MSDPNPPSVPASDEGSTFDEFLLHPTLRQGVREMGYRTPTPVQRRTIPEAVQGRDVVATAQTGTGKTAAFLLPILERLLPGPRGRIFALILTPTRELALQAERFLRTLGRYTRLRGVAVYGGVGMAAQEHGLRGGAEIIVATPGRLLDHIERGYVDFRHLQILVLDEADRMLDMGFLPDVRRIISRLPTNRQTMLFSATMPPEVARLSRDFLRDPRLVQVGETTVAAVGVSHLALPVRADLKPQLLRELLSDATMTSVLVFTRTKHRADRLARQLALWHIDAGVIHGNRSQNQRIRALEGFREGTHRILVATDIAARGIDVEGVSHVVNYDIPHEPEVYIHRVGRTARAQRRGDAFSLIGKEEEDDFHRIEQLLRLEIPRVRIPQFPYDVPPAPGASGRGDSGSRSTSMPPRHSDRGRGDRGRRRSGPPPNRRPFRPRSRRFGAP